MEKVRTFIFIPMLSFIPCTLFTVFGTPSLVGNPFCGCTADEHLVTQCHQISAQLDEILPIPNASIHHHYLSPREPLAVPLFSPSSFFSTLLTLTPPASGIYAKLTYLSILLKTLSKATGRSSARPSRPREFRVETDQR
jgi:hypothetical protein